MRIYLIILLFLMSAPLVKTMGKVSLVKEVANTALSLFTTIMDLFELSTEKNELEQLTVEISEIKQILKTGLNSFLVRLDKSTYQNTLTGYINKVDSCEIDYLNYVVSPSDASKKNLVKCSDIIESVRPLGKYLSGSRIFDGPLLFDLYKDSNGVCNGSAMESIFKTLFAEYAIGCTIATTIERIEHSENASLYANECKDTMFKIVDYVKSLYQNCAPPACRNFHCSVQSIFSKYPPGSPDDLHANLSEMYPWFNFLIFEFSEGGETIVGGNFFVRHDDDHMLKGSKYDIYFFDGDIQITTERQNYSLAIQISQNLLISYSFGNSTMTSVFYNGLPYGTFLGFAAKNNSLCNDKNLKDNRECYISTSNIFSLNPTLLVLISFFLVN